MALLEALVAIVEIGCGTGVVAMLIDKGLLFGNKSRALEEELRLTRQRLYAAEQHVTQLEKQLEWHNRLLGKLEDEHRVAKAEEPVALGDGGFVGAPDQLPAGERADQHQQR